jgi:chromosome partitioning protein
MVITVGGIKGGSGKTTVATNLAVIRSRGREVLLVDADDQGTATDFMRQRFERFPEDAGLVSIQLAGAAVRTETLKLKRKYSDIIIDTGGRDTTSQRAALAVCDLLLVPFVPRSFDVWTFEKVGELVREMRAAHWFDAAVFLNRADPRGQDNNDAAALLREDSTFRFLELQLGSRKAFPNASASGLAVTELQPEDEKASSELRALHAQVFGWSTKAARKGSGR